MNSAKHDAFRDMAYEGLDTSDLSTLGFTHINDPLIENGLVPRSLVGEGSGYINFRAGVAGCIGAIVLGLGLEKQFPRRYSEGLMDRLADVFHCSVNYLEGVENGFDGGQMPPKNLLNNDYKAGYLFGKRAMKKYMNPFRENFQGYSA